MFRVLFICTDNIGRSLTAEYLLRDWLAKNNRSDIEVASAGIKADSDISSFCLDHIAKLKDMGIDVSGHKRTQVTRAILEKYDLVIAMDESQKEWVYDQFGLAIQLYNEIYKGEKSSILITPPNAVGTVSERLLAMVDYFYDSMPDLMKKIDLIIKDSSSHV
jgi:protein-tyrosine-phosphatase